MLLIIRLVEIIIESILYDRLIQFGTFPFRQSQSSSPNGHYNHTEWLHRVPSSFRSVNGEQVNFYFYTYLIFD